MNIIRYNTMKTYQLKWKLRASEHPEWVPVVGIKKKVWILFQSPTRTKKTGEGNDTNKHEASICHVSHKLFTISPLKKHIGFSRISLSPNLATEALLCKSWHQPPPFTPFTPLSSVFPHFLLSHPLIASAAITRMLLSYLLALPHTPDLHTLSILINCFWHLKLTSLLLFLNWPTFSRGFITQMQ